MCIFLVNVCHSSVTGRRPKCFNGQIRRWSGHRGSLAAPGIIFDLDWFLTFWFHWLLILISLSAVSCSKRLRWRFGVAGLDKHVGGFQLVWLVIDLCRCLFVVMRVHCCVIAASSTINKTRYIYSVEWEFRWGQAHEKAITTGRSVSVDGASAPTYACGWFADFWIAEGCTT